MFERFTDRARRATVLAQEEARMLNHNYIGTEHLLLGLIHEGEAIAAQVLTGLGLDLEAVRAKVLLIIGKGQHQQRPTGHIPFTPRAKKILELGLREALQLGHNYIGTEHILLGIIREGEGVGAQVLTSFGLTLNEVRKAVLDKLNGYTEPKTALPTELPEFESAKSATDELIASIKWKVLLNGGDSVNIFCDCQEYQDGIFYASFKGALTFTAPASNISHVVRCT